MGKTAYRLLAFALWVMVLIVLCRGTWTTTRAVEAQQITERNQKMDADTKAWCESFTE